MGFCPNCGHENNDSAKFCKNCGAALKSGNPIKEDYVATGNDPTARVNNSNLNNSNNSSNSKSDNKNLIIICLTIVICAILIAGALVLFSNNNAADNNSDALSDSASVSSSDSNAVNDSSTDDASSAKSTPAKTAESNMHILSGSFETGSGKSDKTYCSVYVGEQYAGESVKISVLYSRDGSNLNQGNIVPKTVDGSGYISVPSANAFKYYPDNAFVTIYDSSGNVLDTQEVYLSPSSGTQTF